jgi:TRAP-type C4-dicarboxylate transport system substrate-binding protein
MIKRLRIGQLQCSLLTGVGLSELEPAVAGLQSIPMAFRDLDEVDLVGEKLHPRLEEMFAAKGLVVLFWTDAGWVQFFSSKPLATPADLRKLKLFSWANTGKADKVARSAGFNPVPLETADILPGLKTGIIDVVAMPPFYALGTQIYTVADHMLALRWAPLAGGLVIEKKTWEKFPESVRAEMLAVARATGEVIKKTSRKESEDAVSTMQQRWGLKVHEPTPDEFDQWRKILESIYPQIKGDIVPDDVWDMAMKALEEHRAAKP